MHSKEIKSSRRGLTFSFAPKDGKFLAGDAFEYVIDASGEIRISLSGARGKHTVSRKRAGAGYKSLIDLRSAEVRAAISGMEKLHIAFQGDEIIVSDAKRRQVVIAFPRPMLAGLRMAAGIGDSVAVQSFFAGEQITFDEYLHSQPLELESMRQASLDVFTVVSLFSGAGIFDYPFAIDPDFAIQYAIDYDAAACESYRRNIGMHVVLGDVHKAFTKDGYPLDAMVSKPDAIIGGPSCKPFSNANRALRLEDHPDSDLLAQYMRIVKTLKPKVFAIENVPAVLTACDGAYFGAIRNTAAECGYQLKAELVRDCDESVGMGG